MMFNAALTSNPETEGAKDGCAPTPGRIGKQLFAAPILKSAISAVAPSVSVVIPCNDAIDSLDTLILSLRKQSSLPEEIICVDDGSTTRSSRETERICRAFKCCLLRLPEATHSFGRRSTARNLGTKHAHCDVVLYVDQDMILGPDYIAGIHRIHAADPLALVKGTRYSIPVSHQHRGARHALWAACEPHRYSVANESLYPAADDTPTRRENRGNASEVIQYSSRWDYCASNNLSVRRCHAERIGFWDENFVGWGEEDMDFSYRLFSAGCRPVLPVNGAVYAYHLDHPVDLEANRHSLQRNARYFVDKYPEMAQYRRWAYRAHSLAIPSTRQEGCHRISGQGVEISHD